MNEGEVMGYMAAKIAGTVSLDYISASSFEIKPFNIDMSKDRYLYGIQSKENLRNFGFDLEPIVWGVGRLVDCVTEGRVIYPPTPDQIMVEFLSNGNLPYEVGLLQAYMVLEGNKFYGHISIETDQEFSKITEIFVTRGLRRLIHVQEGQALEDALRSFSNYISSHREM